MKAKAKKRNPNDMTFRNERALKSALVNIKRRLVKAERLDERIVRLEIFVGFRDKRGRIR